VHRHIHRYIHVCTYALSFGQNVLMWITALFTQKRDSKNTINSVNFDLVAVREPRVQPTNTLVACSSNDRARARQQQQQQHQQCVSWNGWDDFEWRWWCWWWWGGDQTNATTVIAIDFALAEIVALQRFNVAWHFECLTWVRSILPQVIRVAEFRRNSYESYTVCHAIILGKN